MTPNPGSTKHGTTTFDEKASTMGTHIKSELDSTYALGGTTDAPLGEFLQRPVLLSATNWNVDTEFYIDYNPWTLFFTSPLVQRRVEGFRHVRGHLRLRIVVTGNPFQYGRAIVAWDPLSNRGVFNYGTVGQRTLMTCLSQMPHVFIDPTTSEGGEMTLPFFSPYNWIDTTRVDAFDDMGTLHLGSFRPLRQSNSTGGECNIQVYAWMEDVELCTPTASDYATFTYQNNLSTNDEYSSGLISKPATAVAKAAGWFSEIPLLAPYALATEVAASTIGKVAHFFGYSRPNVVTNIAPYRHLEIGELATTNTHEVMPKLAMDGKNSLTVDPRTVGLNGRDEMTISSVVQRQSYLNDFDWEPNDTPGLALCSFAVSPINQTLTTTFTPNRIALAPCAAAAQMFSYWRGSMIYRFSVACSQMHRGKLRIVYEPAYSIGSGHATNQIYTRIIDISQTRDFEIPIEWHATTPWLRKYPMQYGVETDLGYTDSGSATYDPRYHNGKITVYILNPITGPDPTLNQSVSILVSIAGGPDLEFAAPDETVLPFTYRSSDPLVTPQNALTDNADSPVDPLSGAPIESMGDVPTPNSDKSSLVFFGESVASFRTFLRRYVYHSTQSMSASGDTAAPVIGTRLPITTTSLPVREFITHWYAAWRGSVRYRSMGRYTDQYPIFAAVHDTAKTTNVFTSAAIQSNRSAVEAELPYYYNQRFSHARTSPAWANNSDVNTYDPNSSGVKLYNWSGGAVSGIPVHFASGEDFSLFFFVCIPPVYAV